MDEVPCAVEHSVVLMLWTTGKRDKYSIGVSDMWVGLWRKMERGKKVDRVSNEDV